MTRLIRDTIAASLVSTLTFCGYASPARGDEDEFVVTYPSGPADIRLVLTYRNHAAARSDGGEHVVETDFGPVLVHVEINGVGNAEVMTVIEWPAELWPNPPEVTVEDGDEADVQFIHPMM